MKKNVLVIGGGGREHAICQKLCESKSVEHIYAAPGNAGIAEIAECINIKATDIDKIVEFVHTHPDIYMTVVGPDDPLSMGLVDKLLAEGKRVFGPTKAAAELESSKAFSKSLMKKYGIPTAAFEVFDSYENALSYIKNVRLPIVLKADGLALGKGVLICSTLDEAFAGLKEIMLDKKFGRAGEKIVIEEFLEGFEVSVLAFVDGKTVKIMPAAQDHKRAFDGDVGLNTGGMGTYAPVPDFDKYINEATEKIFAPTVHALATENRHFKGIIFFGLMVTADGVKVIEYNARFGDPETQSVLPGLVTDLLTVFDAVIDGTLDKTDIKWDGKCRVCVVAASGGYPLDYEKGKEIYIGGLGEGAMLFHAGTAVVDGRMVTSGGRVLGVVGCGDSLGEARDRAYYGIKKVQFNGMFYRRDICKKYS